ncbi:unnamed protein product [Oppiella nova]|uniref:Tc1-like transposase DDE domain-containing protein n=1 Tax=Oppiella nova TaxID=334625 RepID=A0A7R9M6M6_9ACAR|nr:unnamed protein product [Oppiella nova]CAG2171638.1 unnamed protein product [Oppiella nova]
MILRIVGISEPTYEWCKIDDQELPFITFTRGGGRYKITEPEDDQSHSDAALANNWANLNELRQLPEIQGNANIAAASVRTLRRRLSDQDIVLQPSKNGCEISIRKGDLFMPNSLLTGHLWTGLVSYSLMNLGYRLEKAVVFVFDSYSDFLEDSILHEIDRHFDDGNVHLLHDNHPVHKSNLVRDWINENIGPIEHFVLPHPGLSPDLNACENVGAMIKNLVRTERQAIESEDQLWEAVLRASGYN